MAIEKQENLLFNKLHILIIKVALFIGLPFCSSCQDLENLVLNPGFEDFVTDTCIAGPNSFSLNELNSPTHWFNGFLTGSPGFFSKCISSYTNLSESIPLNIIGYQNVRASGITYAYQSNFSLNSEGVFKSKISSINGEVKKHIFKEPLTGTFKNSLENNKKYYIEFYVSSCQGDNINQISTDAFDLILHQDSINFLFAEEPFVRQSDIVWSNPVGNIVIDTLSWVKLSGCFLGQEGSKFFSIGTFRDTNIINFTHLNASNTNNYASYFYDDFLIYQCDTCCPDQYPVEDYITVNNNLITQGEPVFFETFLNEGHTANLYLFDSAGRIVYQAKLNGTDNSHQIPNNLAAGVYHYAMVTSKKKKLGGKIVVL